MWGKGVKEGDESTVVTCILDSILNNLGSLAKKRQWWYTISWEGKVRANTNCVCLRHYV